MKRKIGESFEWHLPLAVRADGETLRQTAERALLEQCGKDFGAQILGNAPFGFYKETYSKRIRSQLGFRGQKVFLFKAHFLAGQVSPQENCSEDFKWLLQEEFDKELDDEVARRAVSNIIIDETD